MDAARERGHIRQAVPADLKEILAVISGAGLPTTGVRDHLHHFLLLEIDGNVAGTVGLELYGRQALLRSLAVSPQWRRMGEGRGLCRAILERAKALGVEEIVLLTETAVGFFEKYGFRTVARNEVSEAVRTSVEFTSGCPASCACMRMRFLAEPTPPRPVS